LTKIVIRVAAKGYLPFPPDGQAAGRPHGLGRIGDYPIYKGP